MVAATTYPQRGDVYFFTFENKGTGAVAGPHPAVVVSPDVLNKHLETVVIVPLTSTIREKYLHRSIVHFQNREGHAMTDQVTTIGKSYLVKKAGQLSSSEVMDILGKLNAIFYP